MRTPTERELVYDKLGDRFADALSNYDTQRRVQVLVDDMLTEDMVRGKSALDVGCGLGFFSERLKARGANVLATDIGPGLVERTRQRVGCDAEVADALSLEQQFGPDRFDLVLSSECIEHTPSPSDAVRQIARVTKPGGYVVLSTPNFLWQPVVRLATVLRLRPFDGYEKFSSFGSLRRTLAENDVDVLQRTGLHLFPFQFGMHGLSIWCDRHLQVLRGLMINLCVLGRKRGGSGE